MTFLSGLLRGPDPFAERVSLSLMTTYACQLDCSYCQVLKRPRHPARKVIDSAISFLLRSSAKKLELKFFGGEPLLRFDLVKYSVLETQRRLAGKREIQYAIVTNGIALTAEKLAFLREMPCSVVFSLDGDLRTHKRFRSAPSGSSRHELITDNLRSLIASGVNFFTNIVVSPNNLSNLPRNLSYIAELGVKRMQLCYNGAVLWRDSDIMRLVKSVAGFLSRPAAAGIIFLNSSGDSEPVALKTDLIVDTDGLAYMDAAIFLEKRFPKARRHFFIGIADKLGRPEAAYLDRKEHLRRWRMTFSCPEEEKIFRSTLKAGAALRMLFSGKS